MKSVSISEARNGFSDLLRQVRLGETVLVTDRGKPVARIEPCRAEAFGDGGAAALLARRGIAAPPRAALDVESFRNAPRPRLRAGLRAGEAVSRARD